MGALKTYSTRSGSRFPPGANSTAEGVNFSVFSRHAKRIELLLYDSADSAGPIQIVALDPNTNRSLASSSGTFFSKACPPVHIIPGAWMVGKSSWTRLLEL